MRTRFSTIAFRLLFLTAVWLLGTATFTLAQEGTTTAPQVVETTTTEAEEPEQPERPLVAPDVRGLPYVFAKGVLEEAGFAWKVKGKIGGYAVNLVKAQSVKPGTRVVDTGAPRIVLTLAKNSSYPQRGLPQNTAPYPGTKLVLASGAEPVTAEAPPTEASGYESNAAASDDTQDDARTDEPAGTTTEPEPEATEPEPSTDPAETAEVEASGTPDEQAEAEDPKAEDDAPVAVKPKAEPPKRTRAFVEPGAPAEPLDEIPLPLRAKRLQARMAKATSLTDELLDHWRYQHAWIVTGAQFGWWHGAQALRILIKVDEAMQRRWNVAVRSEEIARAALAEVLAKSKQQAK